MKFWMTLEEIVALTSRHQSDPNLAIIAAAYAGTRAQQQLRLDLLAAINAGATLDEVKQQLSEPVPTNGWTVEPHPYLETTSREQLMFADMTDDQLANYAFLFFDVKPSIEGLMSGKEHSPIAIMTAVKERLRWLSRQLDKYTAPPTHEKDTNGTVNQ
jgi:hypothetical protein